MSKSIYINDMRRDIDEGGGGALKNFEIIGSDTGKTINSAGNYVTVEISKNFDSINELMFEFINIEGNSKWKETRTCMTEMLEDGEYVFNNTWVAGGGTGYGASWFIKKLDDTHLAYKSTNTVHNAYFAFNIYAR